MFILPVCFVLLFSNLNLIVISRHQHAIDPKVIITSFSLRTSTSGLRRHLTDDHGDPWFEACEKLNISIVAKKAVEALRDFQRRKGQLTTNTITPNAESYPRAVYSPQAFVDAITEFIVADDQVRPVIA